MPRKKDQGSRIGDRSSSSAIKLANRAKEYVGGRRPTDPAMDCDIELWDLAVKVLAEAREGKTPGRRRG